MSIETKQIYTVEGMTCAHCEQSVREEVEMVAGVRSAEVERASGRLVVRGTEVDAQAVRDAVAAAGYRVAARP